MLVSIITPCFNANISLLKTLECIQNQTYKSYEYIIIDDCSSKHLSAELLDTINKAPKIKLIRRTWNAGAAVTRNRDISEAKGK